MKERGQSPTMMDDQSGRNSRIVFFWTSWGSQLMLQQFNGTAWTCLAESAVVGTGFSNTNAMLHLMREEFVSQKSLEHARPLRVHCFQKYLRLSRSTDFHTGVYDKHERRLAHLPVIEIIKASANVDGLSHLPTATILKGGNPAVL